MIWLVSTRNEIVQNEDELLARSDYIREVMNVVPNEWKIISAMNSGNKYYMCQTNDTYNGAIITGHIGEVIELVYTNLIENIDFIVANTVRRHITGGENCTLISAETPPRLCRTGN